MGNLEQNNGCEITAIGTNQVFVQARLQYGPDLPRSQKHSR